MPEPPSSARDHYQKRHTALVAEVASLDRRFDLVAWSRLVALLLVIALAIGTLWRGWAAAGWGATAVASIVFIVLVAVHARIARRRDQAHAADAFVERGLARLGGEWAKFEQAGDEFLQDSHPYALDLDLFGRGSVFQLLNDTRTKLGERMLAQWLLAPAPLDTIEARQQAVRELAGLHHVREALAVAGSSASAHAPDPEPLLQWAEQPAALRASSGLRVVAWLLPSILVALLVAAGVSAVPSWAFLIPFAINVAVLAKLSPKLRRPIEAASSRAPDLERFSAMLSLIENTAFESDAMRKLQTQLRRSGDSASVEIRRLSNIVSILDARQNGAFRALIAPALLWDLHCVMTLEKWQRRAGQAARGWLETVATFEALASLATFSFEQPGFCFPTIDNGPLRLQATDLGHPLIRGDVRVVNDVTFAGPGSVLLVTGSNMSGKSTLLRSIGVAAVLAMAGAPVCASKMVLGACVVRTSMRVSDSLREGISRFYAELLKIRAVVHAADQGERVLFLLDEILHGTNSRERHIGARSIIRRLVANGAAGAVSTHDLALADLEQTMPGQVQVVHFQEQVTDDKMTFDYRLRPGLVQSGNALRWMRAVGLEVDEA